MDDLFDSFGDLLKYAIPFFYVLLRVAQFFKKAKDDSPAASRPAPSTDLTGLDDRQRAPQRPSVDPAAEAAARLLGRLGKLVAASQRLRSELSTLRTRAAHTGARGQTLLSLLDEVVAPALDRADRTLEAVRAAGGRGDVREVQHSLQLVSTRLDVVRLTLDVRQDPRLDAVLADAEGIADGCLHPLRQFADAHEVQLPRQQPICLPAGIIGGESVVLGLLGDGYPLVFVPDDFSEDLMRWPSIAHELGHVVLNGVPGLLREMGQATGWNHRPDLLAVDGSGVVGQVEQAWSAWREEIFCDAMTVLMLGPAALEGFIASFESPDDPRAVLSAYAIGGQYGPHPPAHLRIHLAAFVLGEVGFLRDARSLVGEWDRIHGFPQLEDIEDPDAPVLALPLADGRHIGLRMHTSVERGCAGLRVWLQTQYRGLAGHSVLAIPGFDLGPGVWARVRRRAGELEAGQAPTDTARVLLAAAVHAASDGVAQPDKLARAVQLAIRGRGEARRRTPGPSAPRPLATQGLRGAILDALVLQEVLQPVRDRQPGKR